MLKYSIDHIHIASADPLKTANFFIRMFAAKKVREILSTDALMPGPHIEMTMADTRLIITPPRPNQSKEDAPRERLGLEHFGLFTNDIKRAVADLKANGARVLDEPYVGVAGNTVAFVEVPDNVIIELKQAAI